MLPPSSLPASQSSAPIDVPRVRQLFATPARVTDSNFLRREISTRMHERLELVKILPQRVLDAGCGVAADFPALRAQFKDAYLLGLDGSNAMLKTALAQQRASSLWQRLWEKWRPANNPEFLCGNFAALPLASNSLDLVWSNLALHWHPQPDQVFAEWRRVLRVDGLLMFSCFGPDTFQEVRRAFAAAELQPPVLPFVDMHDFGDMLIHSGFSTPVMDMETITVTYPSADKLLADVRAWGGNPLSGRADGLLGKGKWAAIRQALQKNADIDGRLPLTFEVIYGHAFRPVLKKTAVGEQIIQLDLRRK